MFKFHCPNCGSFKVAVYFMRPANSWNDMTPRLYQEVEEECHGVSEQLARKQAFATFDGHLPFFCLSCGHVTTAPLQPLADKEHAIRLKALRPVLGTVN